jgi:hypothetical protein
VIIVARSWRISAVYTAVAALVLTAGIAAPPGRAQAGPGATQGTSLAPRPEPTLPTNAVPGSTPDRRAAWERLAPQAKQQALTQFRELVGPRLQIDADTARSRTATAPTLAQALSGKAGVAASVKPRFARGAPVVRGLDAQGTQFSDPDSDGLDQAFEAAVADAFTPYYHVSSGEKPYTGFATFYDWPPQTVAQVFGPVPPISYFRVQPLGFGTDSAGTPVSILRIDYLTLWNRDDGFDTFGVCGAAIGLVESLAGIGFVTEGHDLDNERSAALVAAPIPPSGGYSLDPASYGIYSYYTAAHEGFFGGDSSTYYDFNPPVPAGMHIELGLARSKHSTYTFNPDWHPVIWPDHGHGLLHHRLALLRLHHRLLHVPDLPLPGRRGVLRLPGGALRRARRVLRGNPHRCR